MGSQGFYAITTRAGNVLTALRVVALPDEAQEMRLRPEVLLFCENRVPPVPKVEGRTSQ
jgi:hypothetical protein